MEPMSRPAAVANPRVTFVALSQTAQLAALISIGIVAAIASAYVKRGLGISGSAIVWTVLPTMFGMAAFPRRFAGTTIAASAVAASLGLLATSSGSIGPAALTGFAATGVFADLVVARVRPGWPLYVGLTLAGLAANVVAFGAHLVETAVRVAPGASAAKPWALQVTTYALCGALAGLIAAASAYQLRDSKA
jgi:hypothetical protein